MTADRDQCRGNPKKGIVLLRYLRKVAIAAGQVLVVLALGAFAICAGAVVGVLVEPRLNAEAGRLVDLARVLPAGDGAAR